jgi:transcriptional regulator with XRE-family HTH domain
VKLEEKTGEPWSQTKLAIAIGRSQPTIQNWERGLKPSSGGKAAMRELARLHGLEFVLVEDHADGSAPPAGEPAEPSSPARKQRHTGRDAKWHDMLDDVLASGNEDAITAVQSNLLVFSKYIRVTKR